MIQMVDSALTDHGVDTAGEVQLRSLVLKTAGAGGAFFSQDGN